MIPEIHQDPPTIPNLTDDRPPTPASHLVWRLGGLVIGSFIAIALLGELVKLLVGAET